MTTGRKRLQPEAVRVMIMRRLLNSLRKPFLCLMFLSMFCIAGGHWAVLQTVAWVEMIRAYSLEQGSMIAGVEKTFSGKAPCEKCHQIQEGRQQEEKLPATIKADKKWDSFLVSRAAVVVVPQGENFDYPVEGFLFCPLRTEAPPAPVPIVIA